MEETVNLDVAAARVALGTASPEETAALVGSVYDSEVEGSSGQRTIPLPTAEQAAWVLLELHLAAIAHGRVGPEEGLGLVIDEVFRPAGLAQQSGPRLGDSHDIERLVELQDEYDDMRRYERRTQTADRRHEQVDAQVILAAKEWMVRNATYRVS